MKVSGIFTSKKRIQIWFTRDDEHRIHIWVRRLAIEYAMRYWIGIGNSIYRQPILRFVIFGDSSTHFENRNFKHKFFQRKPWVCCLVTKLKVEWKGVEGNPTKSRWSNIPMPLWNDEEWNYKGFAFSVSRWTRLSFISLWAHRYRQPILEPYIPDLICQPIADSPALFVKRRILRS
jgi:hypothetical protein